MRFQKLLVNRSPRVKLLADFSNIDDDDDEDSSWLGFRCLGRFGNRSVHLETMEIRTDFNFDAFVLWCKDEHRGPKTVLIHASSTSFRVVYRTLCLLRYTSKSLELIDVKWLLPYLNTQKQLNANCCHTKTNQKTIIFQFMQTCWFGLVYL